MTVPSLHYSYVNVYVTTPAVCDVKRGLPVEGGEGGVSHISGSWRLDLYPESMKWFIEDLAFSPSYDLAPTVCRRSSLLTRERVGVGEVI